MKTWVETFGKQHMISQCVGLRLGFLQENSGEGRIYFTWFTGHTHIKIYCYIDLQVPEKFAR